MTSAQVKSLVDSDKPPMAVARELVAAGLRTSVQSARKEVAGYRKFRGLLTGDENRQTEEDYSKGTVKEVFTLDNPPTCLEDALKQSKVDTALWEVEKWIWNHWAGRYQVKVFFKRRETPPEDVLQSIFDEIQSQFAKVKPSSVAGSGVGVVSLADFHYGMDFKGDAKNRPFNIQSLTESIRRVVEKINGLDFESVHLALLGDFLESFSGLNHLDTWQHLSSYGSTAVKGVAKLLATELIGKINNVEHVYLIAGNHDRVSMKKDIDSKGEAAALIHDFLELMVDVPLSFDYAFLNPKIDGVKYIMSHGDLGMSNRDEYATILEYGDQRCYNVILQGHRHRREVKKARKASRNYVTNTVSLEGSNFRKVTVPPMVSGGAYSSSLGMFGTCGMTVIRASGSGVDHLDLSV